MALKIFPMYMLLAHCCKWL